VRREVAFDADADVAKRLQPSAWDSRCLGRTGPVKLLAVDYTHAGAELLRVGPEQGARRLRPLSRRRRAVAQLASLRIASGHPEPRSLRSSMSTAVRPCILDPFWTPAGIARLTT
jgi:hypothetical protein